ncbi:ketopantoate reductase family protein [Aquibacillus salsiterrae]|uniref:2-dehydropantoate 2-reductase n=1 Tax=Aquibacillus salsiterrae TaxID=2950439 RepID=A0A9X3WDL8_9BACI|nr:2-dehydropantoate 2-reductase [Aquibacillus salsiterrae]MDC3416160.1 2-dehydropantoate 2-reductase [Aquibacillus salsiterrae]
MKIVVVGAGAVGAYFGARLEQVGEDVTFLVREKRASQLSRQGLIITSVEGNYAIKEPKVVTSPNDIDEVDLVLFGVKGYHLENSIAQLKTLVNKGAKILPLLNGMEHISILQEKLGQEAVLGGLCFIISTLNSDGDVVHSSSFHDLRLGPLHPSQKEICNKFAESAHNANMNVVVSDDVVLEMWNKYMFITAFSGITTATNLAIGEIRRNPATLEIANKVLIEMQQLANAYDIPLTSKHVGKAMSNLASLADEATSSMHQDRRKGGQLEVEHIHGGALRLAKQKGLTLPYTDAIYGIIKPFENAKQ